MSPPNPIPGAASACPEDAPSPWFVAHQSVLPPRGLAVDVACGGGRHARWLASRGFEVVAVDRDRAALSRTVKPMIRPLRADLEAGGWPFDPGSRFDVVVVSRYLWRPLLPMLVRAVRSGGGCLLYETFGAGNELHGRPRNPEFLLRPGELLEAVAGQLQVVAYQHGTAAVEGGIAVVQRLCAVAGPAVPPRLPG